MFNGPTKAAISTTILFRSIMNKCCLKILRRSLTIFDSFNNNNFILCNNGNNYGKNIKQQQLNIFRRMYSNNRNLIAERGEITSLVVANNKSRTMIALTNLQQEFYDYSNGCNPHNIDDLWYYYMDQKQTFLNNIPIYLHLTLLKTLYEKKEMKKVLTIIKYLRERKNVIKWFDNNLMILECIIKLNIEEAIEKFNFLNTIKGNLSIKTVKNLISSLIKNNEMITAEELFGKIGREYYDIDVYNSMMNGYVKEKKLEKTLHLLELMQRSGIKPNLITYNLLLHLFAILKAQNEAEQTFKDMKEAGIFPDHSSYHGVILSCAKNNDYEKCFYYLEHMIRYGIYPNIYHYSIVMSACVKSGYARGAIELYGRMIYVSKIKPNAIILTILMCAWSQLKSPNSNDLDRIFENIKKYDVPDLIAYTALINAKTKQLKLEEAILVYQQMLKDDIKPNVYTYTTLIDASAKLNNINTALKLFDDMKKRDIHPNQFTYCAIINAFISDGQLSSAFQTFEEMKKNGLKPDVAIINCLMDACNRSGLMNSLFKLYSDLIEKYNLTPDNGTISIYIDACTYNNHFNAGKKFYGNIIKKKFFFSGVKLNNKNYLSIVNLFGQHGYSSEFAKLLNIMKQRLHKPSRILRLVIYNYLYDLDNKKDTEAVNRILDGWVPIPRKGDLFRFKRDYRWHKA
ncbi:hypothetical protein C1645_831312 [Glomus cerebriforme]|uniref:Pentacotripeptide-repeat region of PRORP domain-containing protein n=1 Tax=Glomus cerebriforme TaxID=658196 RepID=A0A397SFS5_9GLOM|nr:hypothetical protein C1645_831312 [Glomus cerebriforme]